MSLSIVKARRAVIPLAETRVIDLLRPEVARDPEMWHGSPSLARHAGHPGSGTKVWPRGARPGWLQQSLFTYHGAWG